MRRPLTLLLALGLLTSCDDDEETESTVACMYDYSVYSISEWGSSFDQYEDECVTLSSAEACYDWTDDSNDCSGGFCSEYSYTNVRVVDGSCEDEGSDDDSGFCEWRNDGECDEPEGTGLCPEGSDAADCG